MALCNLCHSCHMPAVQEERQRSRERAENEAECANSGHEDMPVERILEAELAVEPKTESYGDMNMENSVCCQIPSSLPFLAGYLESQDLTETCSFFRQMILLLTYAMQPTSSFSPLLSGPNASPTSQISPWRTRSFCSEQVRHWGSSCPEIIPRATILK